MRARFTRSLASLGLTLFLVPSLVGGCASSIEGDGNDTSSGGSDASGGAAASGGTTASGGGIATGGTTGSGGGIGSGGIASGGGSSGGASSGGSDSGGSNSGGSDAGGSDSGGSNSGGSGSGGDGTGGGLSVDVDPSPGCSQGAQTFTVQNGQVGYPDGYDGSTPVPMMFAFHGAGGNESSLRNQWGNTAIGKKYLMIYLKSTDSGWNLGKDRSRVEAAYTAAMQNGCVDQNRVFAVGHSSGAQMIVQLLCAGYNDFDAVIPVASSVYCSGWDPVPVLNFHGLDDQERCAYGLDDCDGRKDIVPYYTSNDCENTRTPADLDVGSSCSGNINPGCVEFQGCSEPTFFCNHNDPQYGTSNHGIPCFATPAIMDFLGRFDP